LIYLTATGRERATFTGHQRAVMALAVAPDGSWLATGSSDRAVRIWDVVSEQALAAMPIEHTILACDWLDAQGLAAGGPVGLYVYDFLPGTAPPPRPPPPQERAVDKQVMTLTPGPIVEGRC
jgi:WD40 repeat protein